MEESAHSEIQNTNFSERERRIIESADYLNSYLDKLIDSTTKGSKIRMGKTQNELEIRQEKDRRINLLKSLQVLALRDDAGKIFQEMSSNTLIKESYDDMDEIRGSKQQGEFTSAEVKLISLVAFGKSTKKLLELETAFDPNIPLTKYQVDREVRNRVFGFQLALGIKNPSGEPTDKLLPLLDKVFPNPNPSPVIAVPKAA